MTETRVMAIIGGGACGTMFLHDYLCQLEKDPAAVKAKPPHILWFDSHGRYGHADAFDPGQSDNLILNNPVAMMQPTLAAPALFHDFCTRTYGACDHSAFLPRNVYGHFLKELTPTLFARAQALGIEIETAHSSVRSIHKTPKGRLIVKDDDRYRPVDDVVVTVGPAPNHAADHLRKERGFIASPSRAESFAKSGIPFGNPETRIACFGPGASCFDGMALLEKEFGFKGTYILIGEQDTPFWSIDREKPVPGNVRHHPHHLTAIKLPCPLTGTRLIQALTRDILDLQNPEMNPHDLGPEYPLFNAAAKTNLLMEQWEKIHQPNVLERAQAKMAFDQLQRYAIRRLEHAVAPQMLDLYKSLQQQGRILHVEGRVQIDQISKIDQEFQIPVVARNQDPHVRITYLAEGFMNSKPFARSWDALAENTPFSQQERLLHAMEHQGLIQPIPGDQLGLYDFAHSMQNGVALLGAATDALWGVHLASYKTGIAAETFARKVIESSPRTAPDAPRVA